MFIGYKLMILMILHKTAAISILEKEAVISVIKVFNTEYIKLNQSLTIALDSINITRDKITLPIYDALEITSTLMQDLIKKSCGIMTDCRSITDPIQHIETNLVDAIETIEQDFNTLEDELVKTATLSVENVSNYAIALLIYSKEDNPLKSNRCFDAFSPVIQNFTKTSLHEIGNCPSKVAQEIVEVREELIESMHFLSFELEQMYQQANNCTFMAEEASSFCLNMVKHFTKFINYKSQKFCFQQVGEEWEDETKELVIQMQVLQADIWMDVAIFHSELSDCFMSSLVDEHVDQIEQEIHQCLDGIMIYPINGRAFSEKESNSVLAIILAFKDEYVKEELLLTTALNSLNETRNQYLNQVDKALNITSGMLKDAVLKSCTIVEDCSSFSYGMSVLTSNFVNVKTKLSSNFQMLVDDMKKTSVESVRAVSNETMNMIRQSKKFNPMETDSCYHQFLPIIQNYTIQSLDLIASCPAKVVLDIGTVKNETVKSLEFLETEVTQMYNEVLRCGFKNTEDDNFCLEMTALEWDDQTNRMVTQMHEIVTGHMTILLMFQENINECYGSFMVDSNQTAIENGIQRCVSAQEEVNLQDKVDVELK
ncbi:unnamed protein product [Diamesa serratosioi]